MGLKLVMGRLVYSPLGVVQWLLDSLVSQFVRIYSESLITSGWMSQVCHRVFRALIYIIQPIIMMKTCLIPFQSSRPLPPIRSTLITQSATQLASDIRHRKVKCEDVMAAYIQRIKDVNPIINCVVQERFQEALKEARVVDELLTARPNTDYWKKNKPLLGIPLTVKESIAVKGMSNNAGRAHVSGRVAKEDAEAVALLRRAGAVVVLVSTTPEMCMNWETYNSYQGTSRNPYDTRRVVGGSSGGEGGLLGAGGSLVGIGSDLAGSLRIPSFFTGVFAHKPTPGFIPLSGHIPYAEDEGIYSGTWETLFSLGPMSRYAQDLPLMMSNMIPERYHPELLALDQPVEFKTLKVYYLEELSTEWSMHDHIGTEMATTLLKLIHYFKVAYNLNVQKVKLRECSDVMPLGAAMLTQMNIVDSIYQKQNGKIGECKSVVGTIAKSLMSGRPSNVFVLGEAPLAYLLKKIPEEIYLKLMAKKDRIRKQIEDCLGEDGVLLVPTFPGPAPFHRRIAYQFLNSAYTLLFNITGLPATQCPLALTREGLPIGVQVVAARKQDRLCFTAAKVIQSAFGGWVPPPATQS